MTLLPNSEHRQGLENAEILRCPQCTKPCYAFVTDKIGNRISKCMSCGWCDAAGDSVDEEIPPMIDLVMLARLVEPLCRQCNEILLFGTTEEIRRHKSDPCLVCGWGEETL